MARRYATGRSPGGRVWWHSGPMADDNTRARGPSCCGCTGTRAAHRRERLGRGHRQGGRRHAGHDGAGDGQPLDRGVVRLRGRREHPGRPDARGGRPDRRVDPLPVTADLEGGYGDAAETVRRAIGLGIVGANIEDQMKPLSEAAAQVEAIMKAADDEGVDFVLNARTDAFARGRDRDPGEVLADAIERGRAYLDAGAPVVFVPARLDEEQVTELVGRLRPAAADPDRDPGHPVAGPARGARRRPGLLRADVAERRPHRPGRAGRGGAPRRRRPVDHADAELT